MFKLSLHTHARTHTHTPF